MELKAEFDDNFVRLKRSNAVLHQGSDGAVVSGLQQVLSNGASRFGPRRLGLLTENLFRDGRLGKGFPAMGRCDGRR
jgi:hypothetical protein